MFRQLLKLVKADRKRKFSSKIHLATLIQLKLRTKVAKKTSLGMKNRSAVKF